VAHLSKAAAHPAAQKQPQARAPLAFRPVAVARRVRVARPVRAARPVRVMARDTAERPATAVREPAQVAPHRAAVAAPSLGPRPEEPAVRAATPLLPLVRRCRALLPALRRSPMRLSFHSSAPK